MQTKKWEKDNQTQFKRPERNVGGEEKYGRKNKKKRSAQSQRSK